MAKYLITNQRESRSALNRQVAGGRYALLLIFLFTIVNLVLLLLNTDTYFLFSASLPYYLTMLGMGMDNQFTSLSWDAIGTYTVTGLVISAVILGLYLLFLCLSTKRPGWLLGALILFLLDSAALAVFTFALYENPATNLMDGFLHLWAIIELVQAIRANRKLKKLPPEEDIDLTRMEDILSGLSDQAN